MVRIIAHRGASADFPENSAEAIAESYRQGADMIETDVRQTADGQLVLFHDSRLTRLCGVDRRLRTVTLAEFEKLRIRGIGTPMSLRQLFETADKPAGGVILDVKEFGLERKINKLVCDFSLQDSVIVSSFYSAIVHRVKRLNPNIKTALIMDRFASVSLMLQLERLNSLFLRSIGADYLHVCFQLSILEGARNLSKLGHPVVFWTIDEPESLRLALEATPLGIMTNKPRFVRSMLQDGVVR
jgi:glycerophosphoryl diester phosphodiesterase